MLRKKPLALLFFGLLSHIGATECRAVRTVQIRLIDDAAVKPKLMITARQEAAYALESLCIEVEWVAGSSLKASEIRIIMTPVGTGITDGCLGNTTLDALHGNHGAVFLSRVRALQSDYATTIGLGELLGYVLAHEIGHVLLNSRAHSLGGVMIDRFGEAQIYRAAQGRLAFTPADRQMLLSSQIARRR
jgi:hypothetical protein